MFPYLIIINNNNNNNNSNKNNKNFNLVKSPQETYLQIFTHSTIVD